MTDDTIFALSSGALPAAIAIVRVSGSQAEQAAIALAGALPKPRRASVRRLMGADGTVIDEALVLRFPAPHTATGESLVEFHLHGGRAVVARLLAELGAMPGLREADPGEFTRRALVNGRLDLTEAEGLGDLLAAETEWQRRAAVGAAGGAMRRQVEAWRDWLVVLSAQVEAAIDYVGDEDETALDLASVRAQAADLAHEWQEWLAQPAAELLQNGIQVVLAGPPNSGKSSLFNALVGAEKAIVTPIAGTTRDILEARIDLVGIPMVLIDTAGLRDSDDVVEKIGIARAEDARANADLILWLGEPSEDASDNTISVHARADERGPAPPDSVAVSVRDGVDGLDRLLVEVRRRAAAILPSPDLKMMNRRQRLALADASFALSTISDDPILLADDLRHALTALDRLTGRSSTEDVLDALFARFCLGK